MNLKKKFLTLAAIGFPFGMVICLIITTVISTLSTKDASISLCSEDLVTALGSKALAIVVQELVSGVFGSLILGTTVVYGIEKWSILKSTAIHFCVSMSMYYVTAFTLRWLYPKNIAENLTMLAILIVVYIIIWLANYLSYKKEVRKLNSELEKMKQPDDEE